MTARNPSMTALDALPAAPPNAWRRLMVAAALAATAVDVLLMAIIGQIIPPLAAFGLITVVIAVVLQRRPRALAVGLGLTGLLAVGGSLPFLVEDVRHPADTVAFLWAVLGGGGHLLSVIGAVAVLRDRRRGARVVAAAALALALVAVSGSVLARATVTSDDAVASDVAVPIADIAFPDTITAGSSDTLYVDNRDPVRHDLTVVGTDVAVDLPPGAARRLAVDLPVGTYDVICTVPGHEAMTSTLVVR